MFRNAACSLEIYSRIFSNQRLMSLYLLIDILVILIPFIFSFHPKIRFVKEWKFFIPALLITAAIFIAGDYYFTYKGIWGFNKKYISGISILNLPIEEILFFICIPYACVFTYYVINNKYKPRHLNSVRKFTLFLSVLL